MPPISIKSITKECRKTDIFILHFSYILIVSLTIENERLKKGYMVKGDGQVVIFNGLNNKNMK